MKIVEAEIYKGYQMGEEMLFSFLDVCGNHKNEKDQDFGMLIMKRCSVVVCDNA